MWWPLTSHYIPSPHHHHHQPHNLCGLIGPSTLRRPWDCRLVGGGSSAVAVQSPYWLVFDSMSVASNNWERERESESQNVLNSRDTNRSTFIQQNTAASVSQTVYFFKYVLSIVDPLPTTNHDTVFTDSMKWNKCWMYRRGVEGLPGTSDSDYSDVVMVSWQKIDIRIAKF